MATREKKCVYIYTQDQTNLGKFVTEMVDNQLHRSKHSDV